MYAYMAAVAVDNAAGDAPEWSWLSGGAVHWPELDDAVHRCTAMASTGLADVWCTTTTKAIMCEIPVARKSINIFLSCS